MTTPIASALDEIRGNPITLEIIEQLCDEGEALCLLTLMQAYLRAAKAKEVDRGR